MKTKLLFCALVVVIGLASCTTSYYVTGQKKSHRHQEYKADNYGDRYGDFYRGYRDGYRSSRDYRGGRYRRW